LLEDGDSRQVLGHYATILNRAGGEALERRIVRTQQFARMIVTFEAEAVSDGSINTRQMS